MNHIQRLIAEIRSLDIAAQEKRIKLCEALGDRDGAKRHEREMNALIAARFAQIEQLERHGCCYFSVAGEMSRMQDEARRVVGAQ
jgi:hypothetical protein